MNPFLHFRRKVPSEFQQSIPPPPSFQHFLHISQSDLKKSIKKIGTLALEMRGVVSSSKSNLVYSLTTKRSTLQDGQIAITTKNFIFLVPLITSITVYTRQKLENMMYSRFASTSDEEFSYTFLASPSDANCPRSFPIPNL